MPLFIYSRPYHVTTLILHTLRGEMYASSLLPPLSLSEVSVSNLSPSLPAKKSSSDFILSCNVYFSTGTENRVGRHACGGNGGSGVSSLHTILTFVFSGFISSSGNCFPLNHKGTSCTPWSTKVNLRQPAVLAMLVLTTLKVSFS